MANNQNDKQLQDYHVSEVQYQRILVAIDVDDFTSSDQAFNFACSLAKLYDAQIAITTVVESKDINIFDSLSPAKMGDKRLEASHCLLTYVKKAQEFGLTKVKPILSEGTPDKAILEEVIPSFEPDLVVLGSEAQKVTGKTIGSQAEGIIEKALVSVAVVR